MEDIYLYIYVVYIYGKRKRAKRETKTGQINQGQNLQYLGLLFRKEHKDERRSGKILGSVLKKGGGAHTYAPDGEGHRRNAAEAQQSPAATREHPGSACNAPHTVQNTQQHTKTHPPPCK